MGKELTKRQADIRIKKLLADKAFEIYEYHQAKPKKVKHRDFYRELDVEIFDILWASIYRSEMDYEYRTLQYDTPLNNRIFIELIPKVSKEEFFIVLEKASPEWNLCGGTRIRSIKSPKTEEQPTQTVELHDSETIHI